MGCIMIVIGALMAVYRVLYTMKGGTPLRSMVLGWQDWNTMWLSFPETVALAGAGLLLALASPRLARWIITIPETGCPACGYARPEHAEPKCPECGYRYSD